MLWSDPQPEDNRDGWLIGFIHNVLYENYLKDREALKTVEYHVWSTNDERGYRHAERSWRVEDENILLDDFGG